MLIDFGADINSIYRSSGNVVQTPLDCAMSKGFRSTAKYLQLHGGLPANKLRLSGRKPNALNDQELVTPLSFGADITKRMPDQNELKKNRSVVLYVNRTDSETNDSGSYFLSLLLLLFRYISSLKYAHHDVVNGFFLFQFISIIQKIEEVKMK